MTSATFDDDSFSEIDGMSESEQDLLPLKQNEINQAVVNATDWTVETILSQINKGNIQLNPKFQRRDAWDIERKSRFIESLILGFPVPQLVLAEAKGKKGTYLVIDGKQRLLSIRQFSANNDDPDYSKLKLKGLTLRDDLNGKNLDNIKSELTFDDDLRAFENSPIRTVVIKNWSSESFLYHVFLRLNTGSLPLSPQELRQALHPGPFIEYADEVASSSHALRSILKNKKPDFRMRDAELFIRFFAFKLFLSDYSGDLKSMLDTTCNRLNTQWMENEEVIRQLGIEFEEAYTAAIKVFNNNAFKKWTKNGYESRFNRAIFDIVMYYFSDKQIRDAALLQCKVIEDSFKRLCIDDHVFLSSIEKTTKSLDATCIRLSTWATALNNVLGTNIHVPTLSNNRIN